MTTAIDDILSREAADTMEKLAFIFTYPGEDVGDLDSDGVSARVDFTGVFAGSMVIRIAPAALPELTANMLGLDDGEPVAVAQQHDALKEALNIICGNVLPAIAGKTAVFDLDPPVILAEKAPAPVGPLAGRAVLALDEGRLQLWLHVQGDPARLLQVTHD